MLPGPSCCPNPGSRILSGITRRISLDWEEAYGHGLLAEIFITPEVRRAPCTRPRTGRRRGRRPAIRARGGQYTLAHPVWRGRTGHGPVAEGAEGGRRRKWVRGGSRNGDSYCETVTPVDHGNGNLRASVTVHSQGEEIDAIRRRAGEA